MPLSKRLTAEFLGTLWLVLGGCGSAVLATDYLSKGIGYAGISLAFGLTVLTAAYALGHVSGGHFNPAVSIGLWASKRFPAGDLAPYIIAQVLGAIAAAGIIYLIASGKAGITNAQIVANGLAANGFGEGSTGSPGGYSALAAFVAEVVMTFFFLIVILGATSKRAPAGFAPLAIGLCLTLIHLVTIPVTNTSVNPARSTGPAIFVAINGGSWAIEQLWMFWVAPILGALLAGFFYAWFSNDEDVADAKQVEAAAE
ncbi:MAG: aquaporin Z [Pyrinomonadaceae bacterium]|nr:aquaporin Z [Pyrinomonadaceae bacterium]